MRVRPPPPGRAAHCRSSGRVHARTHARTHARHATIATRRRRPRPARCTSTYLCYANERTAQSVGRSIELARLWVDACSLAYFAISYLKRGQGRLSVDCRRSGAEVLSFPRFLIRMMSTEETNTFRDSFTADQLAHATLVSASASASADRIIQKPPFPIAATAKATAQRPDAGGAAALYRRH